MVEGRKTNDPLLENIRILNQKVQELTAANADLESGKKKLEEKTVYLEATIESLPFDFFAVDSSGRYIMENAACVKRWGDIIGKRPEEIDVDEETKRIWLDNNQRAFSGEIIREEVTFTVKGEDIFLLNIIAPVYLEDSIVGIQGVNVDITSLKKAEKAFEQSETRYRKVSESISDFCYSSSIGLDRSVTLDWVAGAFEEMTGYRVDEMDQGTKWEFLIYPGDLPLLDEHMDKLLNNQASTIKYRLVRKDGEILWVRSYARPEWNDGEKRVTHVYGAIQDVSRYVRDQEKLKQAYDNLEIQIAERTAELVKVNRELKAEIAARKHSDKALEESEEKYRNLVENSSQGFFMTDIKGRLTFSNRMINEIAGYTKEEISQVNFVDLICQEDKARAQKNFQRLLTGSASVRPHSYRFKKKSGEIRLLEATSVPLCREGNIVGIHGMVSDITEQKRAEETQRQTELKYRQVVEGSTDGICIIQDEVIVFTNPQLAGMMGYQKDQITGQLFIQYVDPESHSYVQDQHQRFLSGEDIKQHISTTLIHKDGSHVEVELNVTPFQFEGRRAGLVYVRDCTIRNKMEKELQKTHKLESIGVLAGGIAHDFNNILTGIMGNLSVIQRSISDDRAIKELLSRVEKAALRAQSLTHQLLTFSKGGLPIKKTRDMGKLLVDSTNFALHGSNVNVSFAIAGELWPVECDEGQMNQVINNIILNAVQAMPEGGTISVKADNAVVESGDPLPIRAGRYISIHIADTGTGIQKKHFTRVFDPYFTTKENGTGLGLTTSYSIVKKHGGYITLNSGSNTGTTIQILLPASDKQIEPDYTQIPREEHPGQGKILLMDDEEIILESISLLLESSGYTVVTATDGAQAITLLVKAIKNNEPFNAAILDLTVPGKMGGAQALKEIRKADPVIPVIVSSGYSNDPILAHYKEHGFDDCIVKPYQIEEMFHKLKKLLKL
jgi:PAS domain S-box-containing protein